MKKLLAIVCAVVMSCGVFASCGDSSSKSDESSSKADTTSAPSDLSDVVTTTEPEALPVDISEMPKLLINLNTSSIKFTKDMDPSAFFGSFAEEDYKGTDESHCTITMEEVCGVPMIRVQTLDKKDSGVEYKLPKVRFDMSKLFKGSEDKLPNIFSIEVEFVTKAVGKFKGDDGEERLVPGNFMGCLSTQPIKDDGTLGWNQLIDFEESEWVSEWGCYKISIRPGVKEVAKFVNSTESQYLSIMRWAIPNQADFYIASVTFYDKDKNVIPCSYTVPAK